MTSKETTRINYEVYNEIGEDIATYWLTLNDFYRAIEENPKGKVLAFSHWDKSSWEQHHQHILNFTEKSFWNGVKSEIRRNLLYHLDSDAKGVYYLNEWAQLSNRIYWTIYPEDWWKGYERMSEEIKEFDYSTIFVYPLVNEFRDQFLLAGQRMIKLGKDIAGELSEILWYKQHPDLIQLKWLELSVKESESTEPGVKLKWKGDKTDLAELVWTLVKSGRIADTSTGQLVTQKELTNQVATLLGLDSLDVTGLMKGRMRTYKATSDGNTFIKTLLDSVTDRAANS